MRACTHERRGYNPSMSKPRLAERKAANKARWAMVDAMRAAAFRACAGAPPPPGVTPEAWDMLARAATARADDLRMPDGVAEAAGLDAMVRALDAFLQRDAGEPEG